MKYDLLIKGGLVIDGTGLKGRHADIGVKDGVIAAISNHNQIDGTAVQEIDADGLIVCPGFVDLHTHLDAQVFWDPWLSPTSQYGVTTVIGGNCGFSIAPLTENDSGYVISMLSRVEGIPLEPLRDRVPWSWRTTAEYLDAVDEARPALNMGFMAGHSTIRRAVMGDDATTRTATAVEIQQMKTQLDDALSAGALGFSTSGSRTHVDGNGDWVPSRMADDEELLELSAVTGQHEGTQITLIPCVYTEFSERETLLMTDMSRRADRPVNWNLLVVDENLESLLAISDYATQHGGKVLAITYPALIPVHYTFMSSVFDGVPNWPEIMTLPRDAKLKALKDPAVRQQLRAGLETPEGKKRPISHLERHTIEKGRTPDVRALEGRDLGDVAAERGVDALDLLLDIMIADDLGTGMRRPPVGEDPVFREKRESLWMDPRVIIGGSDAGAHLDFLPAYNYTVKFLELTRAQGEIPLESAIQRITDMPARFYGLRGRGRIAEGWCADLCVFDPDQLQDGAMDWRYDLPGGAARLYSQPLGIKHVLVNGAEIIRDGEHLEARPGRILRSGKDTETVRPSQ